MVSSLMCITFDCLFIRCNRPFITSIAAFKRDSVEQRPEPAIPRSTSGKSSLSSPPVSTGPTTSPTSRPVTSLVPVYHHGSWLPPLQFQSQVPMHQTLLDAPSSYRLHQPIRRTPTVVTVASSIYSSRPSSGTLSPLARNPSNQSLTSDLSLISPHHTSSPVQRHSRLGENAGAQRSVSIHQPTPLPPRIHSSPLSETLHETDIFDERLNLATKYGQPSRPATRCGAPPLASYFNPKMHSPERQVSMTVPPIPMPIIPARQTQAQFIADRQRTNSLNPEHKTPVPKHPEPYPDFPTTLPTPPLPSRSRYRNTILSPTAPPVPLPTIPAPSFPPPSHTRPAPNHKAPLHRSTVSYEDLRKERDPFLEGRDAAVVAKELGQLMAEGRAACGEKVDKGKTVGRKKSRTLRKKRMDL